MNTKTIKLTIESKMELVPLVSKAARAVCCTVVQDKTFLYSLELCIFEAVMNVIEHSYHRQTGHGIDIIVILDENDIVFHVIDSGDKILYPIPEKELDFDEKNIDTFPEEGIGLFLIHRTMDEVTRKVDNEKNTLFMRKHIPKH